ncbi:MAG: hypothetical protein QM539_07335 [Alphaproteobacteria bacterium]|nr:hypothetical protein [Alphaproteobacteria bacterium]
MIFILTRYLIEKKELPLAGVGLLRIVQTMPYILENKIYPTSWKCNLIHNPYFNKIEDLINYIKNYTNLSSKEVEVIYNQFIGINFFNDIKQNISLPGIGYFCFNEQKEWQFFIKIDNSLVKQPIEIKAPEFQSFEKSKNNILSYKPALILFIIAFFLITFRLYFQWYHN